jgi:transcriptional regulator with XRE-family HTH domain
MKSRTHRVVVDKQRLSLEMTKRGWKSNAKAAKALGISESTLWKLRSGMIEPSAMTIELLVSGLDVPYPALFHREELS